MAALCNRAGHAIYIFILSFVLYRTILSGYIFANKARIDNRKNVKQQYLLQMSPQYGELRPTSGWDRSGSLGHPALNRGRHLYSAGRPSRWALAHILVTYV